MAEAIESYGLLGDTRTAALVSETGSIDWMCVPRFDGEPVFGRLIDARGGFWSIRVLRSDIVERDYSKGAVSIRTTWRGADGIVEVHEGMVSDVSSRLMPRSALARCVTCISGTADVEVMFDPRVGLPGRLPERVRHSEGATIAEWRSIAVGLTSDCGISIAPSERTQFSLKAGQAASFVMSIAAREPIVLIPPAAANDLLSTDDEWWRNWLRRFDYAGPHEDHIARSLLTLRLLTYAPSGAPVAAPTTSLPAPPHGNPTWDYRFSWPRDACIASEAFLAFGSDEEARAFLQWFVNASRITRPSLKVVYNLDGRPMREERELSEIEGFNGARPIRIGNSAARQHQLDVYGWVIDAAWNMSRHNISLSRVQWRAIRSFADFIAAEWQKPDHGMWEEREQPRHYVHSKVMAWLGLDRALRLSDSYGACRRTNRWRFERERLTHAIGRRGFDEKRRAYVRVFDRPELDASLLVLPAIGFDESPRVGSTIEAIKSELAAGGSLLYRFMRPDGPTEAAFLPCSFWLVRALAQTGRLAEAETAFDELCASSTPLGLFGEQIDPVTRKACGNFPQAFSHATFLQAAAALNEARGTSQASSRTTRAREARTPASVRRN